MQVKFMISGNEARIQNVQTEWENWYKSHAGEVIPDTILQIVHTHGQYSCISEWQKSAVAGGAVCFISGGPEGDKDELMKLIGHWPERWHVLADPVVGENARPGLRARFGRFLKTVARLRSGDEVPWSMLYPSQEAENLVAFYLWCLGMPPLNIRTDGNELPYVKEVADLAADELNKLDTTGQTWAKCLSLLNGATKLNPDDCQLLVDVLRPFITNQEDMNFLKCDLYGAANSLFHTRFRSMLSSLKYHLGQQESGDYAPPPPEDLNCLRQLLQEAKGITGRVVDEYSPAMLVEKEPLLRLPSELRAAIWESVHGQYLQLNFIQPKHQKLSDHLNQIESSTNKLFRLWARETRLKTVQDLIDKLSEQVNNLDGELKGNPPLLPKYIIMP